MHALRNFSGGWKPGFWVGFLGFLTAFAQPPVGAADAPPAPLPPAAATPVDFVRDIEPLLTRNCYSCHGPERQKADLRWDVKAVALKGGAHGPPIVPGKSADSRMIQLVAGTNPEAVMPPKGDRLTAAQVGQLRAWIDQGAAWPDGREPASWIARRRHWAFQPIQRPAPPTVHAPTWVRNPIDQFVLAKLEADQWSPAPEADRVTLIRRLSLDLTGLPPTIAAVDEYLADQRPDAYERLVDRLLASPHYGERWGRHWLDAARYADTNGYEKDLPRSIWPYRDWVINALNRDLPFDQFTIEQLAGDLLPNATREQKIATGFHRNTMVNEEGGIDPEEFRVASIMNRVETTGKVFLGLTINCVQCHAHKYDPISHQEYYQFYAFLNNDDEPMLEVVSPAQETRRQNLLQQVAALEDGLAAKDPQFKQRRAAWEKDMRDVVVPWQVLAPQAYFGAVGTKFEHLADHSLLATGSSPPVSTYSVTIPTKLEGITGFRLEALADPNLPRNGPGRSANGNFVLTTFEVDAISPDGGHTNHVTFTNATADLSQSDFEVANAIRPAGDKKHGWAVDGGPGRQNQDRRAVFAAAAPVGFPGGATLQFTLKQLYGSEHTIGRFRLSATTAADRPLRADPLPAHLRTLLDRSATERTAVESRELLSYFRQQDPGSAAVNQQIAKLLEEWRAGDTTLVLAARAEPRVTRIFNRGDFRNPTKPVTPDVPAFLPALPPDAPRNRLTLARWLVDGRNPLTARVAVNRCWQAYFGRGLVLTTEDFGTQGEAPSHPELLDWLASEFMNRGWSLKSLHRLIVTSATYRQASRVDPERYAVDPYNRRLARGPRARVEAEVVHDIALSASGLLSEKIGGPSVYPPIPDGVLSLAYGSPMKWTVSTGEDRHRRALYTYWKRTAPYPALTIFDAPNPDNACVRRVMSDTPLQALTTLNDAVFHEAAQALALRVCREGGATETQRVDFAFRLCTGRHPDAAESARLLKLVQTETDYFSERTTTALKVGLPDPKNPPDELNLHRLAAWTLAARVLLNLDETITKE